MGVLYLVGTPIGNLGDMTYRAVQTLEKVDFICAEDTRVTAKLLNYFNIKKPMISYQEHNAHKVGDVIVRRILEGEDAAAVTDAGMPCISDPGEKLVKLCVENGVEVKVVPGPSAVVSALAISGLSTSRFQFEGFLSINKRQRYAHLAAVKGCENTLIFYEAPHKLENTLKDMFRFWGDRKISLCHELTKIHENVERTTLSQAVKDYEGANPKGEFVLIIEGAKEDETQLPQTLEQAAEQVKRLMENGMRGADACKEIAKASEFSKSQLYEEILKEGF